MAVTTTNTNKPINPRGDDKSPLAFNRAKIYSGKALDFDGVNDWVDLAGLNFSGNNQSFCFYLKADAWGNFDYIFDIYTNRFIIGSKPANNFAIYDGNVWQSFGEIYDTTNTNFFVVTIEGTTCKAYLNGVQFGSDLTISLCDFAAASQCALMAQYDGGQLFFNGSMSGFKAFNTTLTAAQVLDLYNNPEKIVPTGVSNDALKLWLPMMEGAGTTAYDGSGNGNHGTISGATYTHGIGAPVAQTAVIDWNKGTNLTNYSEDGTQFFTGGNVPTITQDQADPFGGTRAQRITMDADGTFSQAGKVHTQILSGVQYTAKMWLKAVSGTPTIGINYNGSGGNWHQVTLTNEWAEYEVTRTMNADYGSSHNIVIGSPAPGTSSTADFFIYGFQIQLGDTAGPYVPTFGTAQGSDVLLPQGLTSGRDITGVNLFENVRKQYALNLDGQSWAEVHDNESLDITDAITLEAWVYWDTDGATGKGILGRWTSGDTTYLLYKGTSQNLAFYINLNSTGINTMTTGWHHIVGTYDKSNLRLYVDGSQENSAALTIAIPTSGRPLEIGRHEYSALKIYDNSIAQPRIYNRALTADEVEQNYNAGKNTYS